MPHDPHQLNIFVFRKSLCHSFGIGQFGIERSVALRRGQRGQAILLFIKLVAQNLFIILVHRNHSHYGLLEDVRACNCPALYSSDLENDTKNFTFTIVQRLLHTEVVT
jgi:hypothetical protein